MEHLTIHGKIIKLITYNMYLYNNIPLDTLNSQGIESSRIFHVSLL